MRSATGCIDQEIHSHFNLIKALQRRFQFKIELLFNDDPQKEIDDGDKVAGAAAEGGGSSGHNLTCLGSLALLFRAIFRQITTKQGIHANRNES